MDRKDKNEIQRARTILVLYLVIFCFGRLNVWMNRPIYPQPAQAREQYRWPPPEEVRILNAVDSPVGGIHFFKGGARIGEAIESLEVRVDPHRSRRVLPRASVMEKKKDGWTVRPMSQTERWIWRIPMELNLSSSDDLQRIPGIGPVLAERIAHFVSERVWVSEFDSLLQVKGVGHSKLKALREYLEVEGYGAVDSSQ